MILDSTKQLKKKYRQTFEIRKNDKVISRHTLLLNPEDQSVQEPSKSSVTQTLGGAYVVDFGRGLPQVTMNGITGYKARENDDGIVRDGYTEYVHFRDEIYRKFITENDPAYSMRWYNWEDEEYYEIQPTLFRLQRNKQQPLLYRYEFQFTCLREVGAGTAPTSSSSSEVKITGDTASNNYQWTQEDIGALLGVMGVSLITNVSSLFEYLSKFNKQDLLK